MDYIAEGAGINFEVSVDYNFLSVLGTVSTEFVCFSKSAF